MNLLGALLFCGLLAPAAQAAEIPETFSSRANLASGTAIWNQALGAVHPTLQVMNFKPGFTPLPVDVGIGEHGDFDVATYANFSVGGNLAGNIIRLDTTVFPVLKVTSFRLAQGWTLEPVGGNPLIIYSLADVEIAGSITCNGEDGGDAVGGAAGLGGAGRCGGKNGGDGGATGQAGDNGDDAHASVTGGRGGNFSAGATVGGGGGGSLNTTSSPANGSNASGAGGFAGSSFSDPEFTLLVGGAGGGGGGSNAVAAGAGGGGGGGVVVIHAVRDFILGQNPASIFGSINVSGGKGGDSNVAGGPGGGGGGGSVQVFVGRGIEIYNTDVAGASRADSGAAGVNAVPAGNAVGGPGRSWFSSVTYNLVGTGYYTPSEEAPVVPGNVEFFGASQFVISRVFDLNSSRPGIAIPSTTPVSADFTVEVSGSNDGFLSDDTGWTTDVSLLQQKRYLKYKITITTSNVNDPDMLDSLLIPYAPRTISDFEMTSSGCGRVESQGGSPRHLLPWLLMLFAWAALRCGKSVR